MFHMQHIVVEKHRLWWHWSLLKIWFSLNCVYKSNFNETGEKQHKKWKDNRWMHHLRTEAADKMIIATWKGRVWNPWPTNKPWPTNEEPSSGSVSPVPWDDAGILPGELGGWPNLLPCGRAQSSTGSHSCQWDCLVGRLLTTASSPVTTDVLQHESKMYNRLIKG